MKKIIILLLSLLCFGCNKEKIVEKESIVEKKDIVGNQPIVYKASNETLISIYKNRRLIKEYNTSIKIGKDIALFNIYPSNEELLNYNNFGESFYNEFNKYNKNKNLKIGFNLKYSTEDNGDISHTILNIEDTDDYQGYILIFLYDDYDIHKNNLIYSHIEEDKENTLYSSIKLYPQSAFPKVNSKIKLTVFTYDGLDDFDENGEYRGNSKYSIEICDTNKTC